MLAQFTLVNVVVAVLMRHLEESNEEEQEAERNKSAAALSAATVRLIAIIEKNYFFERITFFNRIFPSLQRAEHTR